MMRRIIFIYFGVLFFTSCVGVVEPPSPLFERAPSILKVSPEEGFLISSSTEIAVFFSAPMDPASIGTRSIFLIKEEQELFSKSVSDWYDDADDGKLPTVSLSYSLQEDGRLLVLSIEEDLEEGANYFLWILPRVLSSEKIPLLNDEGLFEPFQVAFRTNPLSSSPLPGGSPNDEIPQEEPFSKVVINEIYYDAVGNDTDGVLFIELAGEPNARVEGFKINFVDGSDGSVDDFISLPKGARLSAEGFYVVADAKTGSATSTNVPSANLIDNFDPQNGPDAIQLLDARGGLMDVVGYGEGIVSQAENSLSCFEGITTLDVMNGHSLERKERGVDTDDNRMDFMEREIPTPGQ